MSKLVYLAQLVDNNTLPKLKHSGGADDLRSILLLVFGIMGAAAFLLMVLAGFRYIIAAGDAQKTATARRMIVYTAIGLAVASLAFAIVSLVLKRVG